MATIRKPVSATDVMQTRLMALDARIARMRRLPRNTRDTLAQRLMGYSEIERKEVLAKLKG